MTQISQNQNEQLNEQLNERLSKLYSATSSLVFVALLGGAITVGAITLTGCDRTYVASAGSDSSESKQVEPQPKPKSTPTTSVAVEKVNNFTSPAEASKDASTDATPDGVCRKFMKLLQSGNRISAENLLTRTALTVTTRAGLQLEPMGGPNSIFKVNQVAYATNKHKLAQVQCTVLDNVDGESYEMDMAWLVRKYSTGWRISGVMLELEPGKAMDLLSFENVRDVNKIKALAGAEVIDIDDQSRHAKSQDSAIK